MRTTMEGRVCVRVSGTTWRGEGEKRERSLCETASAASGEVVSVLFRFRAVVVALLHSLRVERRPHHVHVPDLANHMI